MDGHAQADQIDDHRPDGGSIIVGETMPLVGNGELFKMGVAVQIHIG